MMALLLAGVITVSSTAQAAPDSISGAQTPIAYTDSIAVLALPDRASVQEAVAITRSGPVVALSPSVEKAEVPAGGFTEGNATAALSGDGHGHVVSAVTTVSSDTLIGLNCDRGYTDASPDRRIVLLC